MQLFSEHGRQDSFLRHRGRRLSRARPAADPGHRLLRHDWYGHGVECLPGPGLRVYLRLTRDHAHHYSPGVRGSSSAGQHLAERELPRRRRRNALHEPRSIRLRAQPHLLRRPAGVWRRRGHLQQRRPAADGVKCRGHELRLLCVGQRWPCGYQVRCECVRAGRCVAEVERDSDVLTLMMRLGTVIR